MIDKDSMSWLRNLPGWSGSDSVGTIGRASQCVRLREKSRRGNNHAAGTGQ